MQEKRDRVILFTEIPESSSGDPRERYSFRHNTAQRLLRHAIPELKEPYTHSASGKPLVTEMPECNISVSHSLHHVAVAVSFARPAPGIDIEDRAERAEKVLQKFAHEQEYSFIEEGKISAGLLWSAKEAIYKYLNHKGLIEFKTAIRLREVCHKEPLQLIFQAFPKKQNQPVTIEVRATSIGNALLVWADIPHAIPPKIEQIPFEVLSSIII
ncbi:MAG: 4'-phosphopantetheinyl transferase superfamily protein [Porphyromonas sp.]|nr:4'-phosphopantetheinyl transferase superfamily protein [Porphyromonas sp.]